MQPDKTSLEFWINVNLPFAIKILITEGFKINPKSFVELGHETTDDVVNFNQAYKMENIIIIITTKDTDYIYLRKEKRQIHEKSFTLIQVIF